MAKRRIFKVCQNCPGRKPIENPENYILIEKEKFVHLFGWLKANINLNYGGRNREQLLRWVNELEELLRKNEETKK
ncbi:MAG: hypothetical protein DRP00_06050 [Candidatus Aenigmatarchaeota archaeon]|nr:MAG: hypothetical protein DRP00_06050 [Candidatus Aenigmarchaeota archaeon]